MNDAFLPLRRYAQFSGRARRREYWLFLVVLIAGIVIFSLLDAALGLGGSASSTAGSTGDLGYSASFNLNGGILAGIWALVTFIPSLAVTFRRLHDTDRSAWWILIGLVPLAGAIALLVFMCSDGTPGDNRFGPNPKTAG